MNRIAARLALTSLVIVSFGALGQTPAACDRACLKSTLDTYLQAVVKHYPGPERPVPNWPPYDGNFPLSGTAPTP